jgi:hypothetical protein
LAVRLVWRRGSNPRQADLLQACDNALKDRFTPVISWAAALNIQSSGSPPSLLVGTILSAVTNGYSFFPVTVDAFKSGRPAIATDGI